MESTTKYTWNLVSRYTDFELKSNLEKNGVLILNDLARDLNADSSNVSFDSALRVINLVTSSKELFQGSISEFFQALESKNIWQQQEITPPSRSSSITHLFWSTTVPTSTSKIINALKLAVTNNQPYIAYELLKHLPEVKSIDIKGPHLDSLLVWGIDQDASEFVIELLKKDKERDLFKNDENSILSYAIQTKKTRLLESLDQLYPRVDLINKLTNPKNNYIYNLLKDESGFERLTKLIGDDLIACLDKRVGVCFNVVDQIVVFEHFESLKILRKHVTEDDFLRLLGFSVEGNKETVLTSAASFRDDRELEEFYEVIKHLIQPENVIKLYKQLDKKGDSFLNKQFLLFDSLKFIKDKMPEEYKYFINNKNLKGENFLASRSINSVLLNLQHNKENIDDELQILINDYLYGTDQDGNTIFHKIVYEVYFEFGTDGINEFKKLLENSLFLSMIQCVNNEGDSPLFKFIQFKGTIHEFMKIFSIDKKIIRQMVLLKNKSNQNILHKIASNYFMYDFESHSLTDFLSNAEIEKFLLEQDENGLNPMQISAKKGEIRFLNYVIKAYPHIAQQFIQSNDESFQYLMDSRIKNYSIDQELLKFFQISPKAFLSSLMRNPSFFSKFYQDLKTYKERTIFNELFSQFPILQSVNNSMYPYFAKKLPLSEFFKALTQKIDQFIKESGDRSLEIALILGDGNFLSALKHQLTTEQFLEQKEKVIAAYPLLAKEINERVENLEWQMDEAHLSVAEEQAVKLPPEALSQYQSKMILDGFKSINFKDVAQAGFTDPTKLKNDVGEQYVTVTVQELTDGMEQLFNEFIPKRKAYTATPPSDTPEIEVFYANLEGFYKEVMFYLDKVKEEIGSSTASEMEKRDAWDKMNATLIQIAVSSLHCGTRWNGVVLDEIENLKGLPADLEKMLNRLFANLRVRITEAIAGRYGSDAHTYGTLIKYIGKRMAIPNAHLIDEKMLDKRLTEEGSLNEFHQFYNQNAIKNHFLESLQEKKIVKDAFLGWLQENPGDWQREEFENTLSNVQKDSKLNALIQGHGEKVKNESLKIMVNASEQFTPSERLKDRLAELELIKVKKPAEYALELEGILRDEYRGFPEFALRGFSALLSVDTALQEAFEDLLIASFSPYKESYQEAFATFKQQILLVDQANQIVQRLKKHGVAISRETAKQMIIRPNGQEILADMLQQEHGMKFLSEVYYSLGEQLVEKLSEELAENEELYNKALVAETPQEHAVIGELLWKAAFKDEFLPEKRKLKNAILQDDKFREAFSKVIKAPIEENIEPLIALMMQEPGLKYRVEEKEVLRFLQAFHYIKLR